MSTMLDALLAAIESEAPFEVQSRGGTSAPVPADHVAALVAVFRKAIAEGKGDGHAVPIPSAWFVTAREAVLDEAGSPVLDEAGNPVTFISGVQPWTTTGNPAETYSKAVQAVLCACKGGDGSAVWIGQSANSVEHGPRNTAGKRAKVNLRAGLVLRDLIPKAAKVPAEFAHLQAK
jgi:hypothetical protein